MQNEPHPASWGYKGMGRIYYSIDSWYCVRMGGTTPQTSEVFFMCVCLSLLFCPLLVLVSSRAIRTRLGFPMFIDEPAVSLFITERLCRGTISPCNGWPRPSTRGVRYPGGSGYRRASGRMTTQAVAWDTDSLSSELVSPVTTDTDQSWCRYRRVSALMAADGCTASLSQLVNWDCWLPKMITPKKTSHSFHD